MSRESWLWIAGIFALFAVLVGLGAYSLSQGLDADAARDLERRRSRDFGYEIKKMSPRGETAIGGPSGKAGASPKPVGQNPALRCVDDCATTRDRCMGACPRSGTDADGCRGLCEAQRSTCADACWGTNP